MTSPAERYELARRRTAEATRSPALAEFAGGIGFELDPFQRDACEALERGSGVLVCAPTGAGKTVVGEFAVQLALAQGRKCFYTTPIKALSNQKFHDLVRRYGAARVGLLTGDNSINGDAAVVVMTTELLRYTRGLARSIDGDPRRGRGRRGPVAYRSDVVDRLDREGLLPAILFIFSRAGCDAAVQQCLQAGLRLTTPDERAEIRAIAESRTADMPAEDLNVLGYWEWLDGLERGLAAHHAGMLPAFKEIVEELFVRGLVKAVFATETLALGINMPARCGVLERLVKFNGEQHVDLTPGEYTQLTGRAGRRGIDVEGHAVVVWSPEVDPRHVAGLASTRTYPLRSSFRPSYNMAVNLVGSVGASAARDLLESSFAQFQADRSVVGLARQVQRNTETMHAYAAEMECELGDFAEYFEIRRAITEREKAQARQSAAARKAAAAASIERLKVGDVIRVPHGRRAGLAVILDPGTSAFGEPRPLVLTEDRWAGRVSAGEFAGPVEPLGRVRVPRHFNHRSPAERRD